ncbi:thrombospondin type 3 repeat-containing protein, partial [Flavobacterium sp. HXWNR69]
ATVVVANVIDAVNDTPTAITSGDSTPSVIINDTLDGAPVVIGTNLGQVTLTGTTVPAGLTLNPNGTITVAAGTPSGTYTVTYQICENGATPANCDTATATVIVSNVIDAVNDTTNSINGVTGGTSTSTVILNDTLDGAAIIIGTNVGQVTLTGVTIPTGLTLNSNGTISVAPNTPSGTYTVVYQICENGATPANCDTATVTVIVGECIDFPINDCDGDGVTNGQEVTDGTNPNDPCSLVLTSQTLSPSSAWLAADCDGDGVTNGQELTDGTNPNNPCSYTGTSQTLATSGLWLTADCDGDGVTNGQEVTDGTNPNDPCSLVLTSQTLSPSSAWLAADCDGDGVTNGQELTDGTNPNNPCSYTGTSQTLATSGLWLTADCDGDGVTNGQEVTDGTNPNDPCSLVLTSQTLSPSSAWLAADCDGDGVT